MSGGTVEMLYRSTSSVEVKNITDKYPEAIEDFDANEWLADYENLALFNDAGDLAMFSFQKEGVYTGHYFFLSRGRQAVKAAKELLEFFWETAENAQVLVGLTPLEKLGARWMNKQLKFTSHGVVQTVTGPCELVILTKKEWEINNG